MNSFLARQKLTGDNIGQVYYRGTMMIYCIHIMELDNDKYIVE